jgi:hypothetical protein
VPVTIRRPVVVIVDDGYVGPPDPAVVVYIGPVTISVQIFGAPNVVVVILSVVAHALGQVAFAIINPVVPRITTAGY